VPAARLILASASPQRRAILQQISVAFEVRPAAVTELSEGPAAEVALENAYRKAAAIAPAELPVLGVDTVVSLGAQLFGKPREAEHAAEMLAALAGARHVVISGVCLIDRERVRTAAAQTVVQFRALSTAAIDAYVRAGEWEGRAGAYAIQGRGAMLVERIEGDYLNVVGLPVATLLDLVPELLAD
jgi:nucleoside triphosphate pyrophosphatase